MVLTWQEAGPSPIFGGGNSVVEGKSQIGAITSILQHPTDPNTLWVGAVNGGIWRSSNATAANPTWTTATDDNAPSLSIGALDVDYRNPQNLVAGGFGNFSSSDRQGGILPGMLLSDNGGTSWRLAPDTTGTLKDLSISGVVIRGQTIVVTANTQSRRGRNGVNGFARSVDGGNTFTDITNIVSSRQLDTQKLQMTDLAGDRAPTENLFAASLSGVFYSNNLGESWNDITQGILNLNPAAFNETTVKVKLAVGYYSTQPAGQQTVVYVGIVNTVKDADGNNKQRLTGVYRSSNFGATWTQMDLPSTQEPKALKEDVEPDRLTSPGIHPGGQGDTHFSIGADPRNPNIVYVGGDRQPGPIDGTSTTGAQVWSGHLFQGDASNPAGQQWTPITNKFANSTAPHADSRDIAFDLSGNLLESDDGGIYRFDVTNRRWSFLSGSSPNQFTPGLRITEFISLDWDANADLFIGGAQDNGVSVGRLDFSGSSIAGLNWVEITSGDGGVVRVDDLSPQTSYQYFSSQTLGNFGYREVDATTRQAKETVYAKLNIQFKGKEYTLQQYEKQQSGQDPDLPFTTPVETNKVKSGNLVIGTKQSVYESTDRGSQLVDLFLEDPKNSFSQRRYNLERSDKVREEVQALAYGGKENGVDQPDVLYVGTSTGQLFRRDPGGLLTKVPFNNDVEIRDIALNPNNWREVYVLTSRAVWRSLDAGVNFTNITGNLIVGDDRLEPGTLRTVEYITSEKDQGLVVGGLGGVRALTNPAAPGGTPLAWRKLGDRLPNLNVMELNYDIRDDVLVAATLGRGAWFATSVKAEFGGNPTPTPALPSNPIVATPSASVSNARAPEQAFSYVTDEFDDDEGDFLEDGTTLPALVFEISLSGRSTVPVTMRLATIDGSATGGTDYELLDRVITFATGETKQQVRIQPLDDNLTEPDEKFSLVILDIQGGTIADGVGIGIIETDPGEFAPHILPTLRSPDWRFGGLSTTAANLAPASTASSTPDILWRDYTTGNNVLWSLENGDDVIQINLPSFRDPNWVAAGATDFTNDGNSDIFWYNTQTGATQIWELKNSTLVAVSPLSVSTGGWVFQGFADLTGDNSPDIIWQEPNTGAVSFWEMKGTQFANAGLIFSAVATTWKVRAIADFTGDGNADFLWQNDDGTAAMWQMNRSSIVQFTTLPTLGATQIIAGAADFDGDEQIDILLHEYESRNTSIWFLDKGRFDGAVALQQADSPTWRAQAIADFDDDDQVDILWRDIDSGVNTLWILD
ncbi:MAG: FG-GAP-like repeat-containing protein [Leptolyngbyaceae cyanobacterium bins.302]|nr:FG-GAP-like repeat-containing protein [Leptolyngbyaceae cyanobacterium bins.302]